MPTFPVVFLALALTVSPAPDPVLQGPFSPAARVSPPRLEAPPGSRCPDLYAVAVDNWPGAEDVWGYLDYIFFRESRCRPEAVNRRSGTRGLMQVSLGNLRRLGVSRAEALDPVVNIRTGYELCQEWVRVGRSCWRPWWLGRWRP